MRARDCELAVHVAPGIASGCQDARHMQVASAAKRTLMHICLSCAWVDDEPPAPLRSHGDTAAYVAEFARRSLKRLAGTESEPGEVSDQDI
jgi:hypothetical protein